MTAGEKVKCRCGKEMCASNLEYHRLRCSTYKDSRRCPYPVETVTDEELKSKRHNRDNTAWIKTLVYKYKKDEVLKVTVPDKTTATHLIMTWRYHAKKRGGTAVASTVKTWKGRDVYLSIKGI